MKLDSTSDDDWRLVLAQLAEPDALEASARAYGAIERVREVRDAASLLRLALAYGPGGQSLRGTAAWAELSGVARLSNVALMNRLRGAADWLGALAGALLAEPASAAVAGERPIRIVDGTTVSAPGRRGADWRLHVAYDPLAQRFTQMELTDAHGAEKLERASVAPGEIRLADRCFARPEGLRSVLDGAGDYVVRVGWRGLSWLHPAGGKFAVKAFLAAIGEGDIGEAAVLIGKARHKRGWTPLPARLIAVRLPPEAAEQNRRKAGKASRKNGNAIQPTTLAAAGYLILITSLDAEHYPPERIAALYRLRWQVELAFKRLKSILRLDRLPAKDPDLARAWLNSHLIAALIIDAFAQDILDSPPCAPSRAPRRLALAPRPKPRPRPHRRHSPAAFIRRPDRDASQAPQASP